VISIACSPPPQGTDVSAIRHQPEPVVICVATASRQMPSGQMEPPHCAGATTRPLAQDVIRGDLL
jgi:hypothetical protein